MREVFSIKVNDVYVEAVTFDHFPAHVSEDEMVMDVSARASVRSDDVGRTLHMNVDLKVDELALARKLMDMILRRL